MGTASTPVTLKHKVDKFQVVADSPAFSGRNGMVADTAMDFIQGCYIPGWSREAFYRSHGHSWLKWYYNIVIVLYKMLYHHDLQYVCGEYSPVIVNTKFLYIESFSARIWTRTSSQNRTVMSNLNV